MNKENTNKASQKELNYFKKAKPTFLENWDIDLMEHTIRSLFIKLTLKEVETLLMISRGELSFTKDNIPLEIKYVYDLVDKQIKKLPNGGFIRLGSRSPKDSLNNQSKNYRMTNAFDAFTILLESDRIIEDFSLMLRVDYEPFIVVREWLELEKHLEFRGFIKNNELKGLSQYYYDECFIDLQDQDYLNKIIEKIQYKFNLIKEHIHLKDIIIDFIIYNNEVYVLELNPFIKKWTDSCLFDWKSELFDEFKVKVVSTGE